MRIELGQFWERHRTELNKRGLTLSPPTKAEMLAVTASVSVVSGAVGILHLTDHPLVADLIVYMAFTASAGYLIGETIDFLFDRRRH